MKTSFYQYSLILKINFTFWTYSCLFVVKTSSETCCFRINILKIPFELFNPFMKVILEWNILFIGISKEFFVQAIQFPDRNHSGWIVPVVNVAWISNLKSQCFEINSHWCFRLEKIISNMKTWEIWGEK